MPWLLTAESESGRACFWGLYSSYGATQTSNHMKRRAFTWTEPIDA